MQCLPLAMSHDNRTATHAICIKQSLGHVTQDVDGHEHSNIVCWKSHRIQENGKHNHPCHRYAWSTKNSYDGGSNKRYLLGCGQLHPYSLGNKYDRYTFIDNRSHLVESDAQWHCKTCDVI